MTERGFSDEELERQLQEEEKGLEQQEPAPEVPIEASNEKLEKEIDLEGSKAESNEKMFDQNLAAVGEKEGLQKTWSEMDENKRTEITKKIEEYSKNKQAAIMHQKDGVDLINPLKVYKDGMFDTNTIIGNFFTGTISYVSGVGPTLAGIELVRGTYNRVKNAMSLGKEKRKLTKLENKYQ